MSLRIFGFALLSLMLWKQALGAVLPTEISFGDMRLTNIRVLNPATALRKLTEEPNLLRGKIVFDRATLTLFSPAHNAVLIDADVRLGVVEGDFRCTDERCLRLSIERAKSNGVRLDLMRVGQFDLLGGKARFSRFPVSVFNAENIDSTRLSVGRLGFRGLLELAGARLKMSSNSSMTLPALSGTRESLVEITLSDPKLSIQEANLTTRRGQLALSGNGGITLENLNILASRVDAASASLSINRLDNSSPSLVVKDARISLPQIHVDHFAEYVVSSAREVSADTIAWKVQPHEQEITPDGDATIDELRVKPDSIKVQEVLNAPPIEKVLLPTNNAHIRFVDAQALRIFYESIGIAPEDLANHHIVILPVRDGVIYAARPDSLPINDPPIIPLKFSKSLTAPYDKLEGSAITVAVGEMVGDETEKLTKELVSDLLMIPILDSASLAFATIGAINPFLGFGAAVIVVGVGKGLSVAAGKVAGGIASDISASAVEAMIMVPGSRPQTPLLKALRDWSIRNVPPMFDPRLDRSTLNENDRRGILRDRFLFLEVPISKGLANSMQKERPRELGQIYLDSFNRLSESNADERTSIRIHLKDQSALNTLLAKHELEMQSADEQQRELARKKMLATASAASEANKRTEEAKKQAGANAAAAAQQSLPKTPEQASQPSSDNQKSEPSQEGAGTGGAPTQAPLECKTDGEGMIHCHPAPK